MSFSLCNENEMKQSQEWINYFEGKNQYLLQTYQQCIENKLTSCHLLLEDARSTNSERLHMLKYYENMQLKCSIEKQLQKSN